MASFEWNVAADKNLGPCEVAVKPAQPGALMPVRFMAPTGGWAKISDSVRFDLEHNSVSQGLRFAET